MADIAVLIKTLGRDMALFNCLHSVRERLEEQSLSHRIYLADDGPVGERKRELYDSLRKRGHLVLEYDERIGVSRARNELADRLEDERLVLRMDDDFELTGETDVAAMGSILEEVPSLGVIADLERQVGLGKGTFSGRLSDAQGYFERRGSLLERQMFPSGAFDYETAGGCRFARCDFTRNLLLIRREVLEEVRWEDRLAFAGEHEDFLLQLGVADWEVAFTPESIHRHREDLAAEGWSYGRSERRRQRAEAMKVFQEKWGIRRKTVRRTWLRTLEAGLVRVAKTIGFGP